MKYLFIIFVVLFVVGFGVLAFFTVQVRKKAYNKYKKKFSEDPIRIPVAHAGADDGATAMRSEELVGGLDMIEFKNSRGEIMKPSDYDLFIVQGECMQYVNIHDNNLVFATKGFDSNSYEGKMPIVLVMKRTTAEPSKPQYKLRRSWRFCEYSSDSMALEKVIKEIMTSPEYQEIKNRATYDSDNEMLKDFRNRLKLFEAKYITDKGSHSSNYKDIVISTTYHTDIEKTRFSIHPVSNIIGKVEGAFKLPDECILGN